MATQVVRTFKDTLLKLDTSNEEVLYTLNHIFEPDYHQDKYVKAYQDTVSQNGAFQVGDKSLIERYPFRGRQPFYADDPEDPESLIYEGMIGLDGERVQRDIEAEKETGGMNVCALTSACVRQGYVDLSLARSVARSFYEKWEHRAGVQKNDVFINSTGDGTIGRVAVYDYDFPALVDGHITILRYKEPIVAWYVATFLLTEAGQHQLYRFINGSSGQVEIYPQDIARIWIKPADKDKMDLIGSKLKNAAQKYDAFYQDIRAALHSV